MALLLVRLQGYQTSLRKMAQAFVIKVTKANYLAKRWHLEAQKLYFLVGVRRKLCTISVHDIVIDEASEFMKHVIGKN